MNGFQVIPAVDILGGRCVRLYQGDYSRVTDYGDPLQLARRWFAEGAEWIHVVDLEGARSGKPAALELVQQMRAEIGSKIQYGGGLRNAGVVERALRYVDRVIISSWAMRDPEAVAELCSRFTGKIVVSLDLRDGKVWVDGWQTASQVDPATFARHFTANGAAGVVVTSIEGDGTLSGVPAELVKAVAGWGVPFWWAGGIASADDVLTVLREGGAYVQGVVVGRALYAGTTSLTSIMERISTA